MPVRKILKINKVVQGLVLGLIELCYFARRLCDLTHDLSRSNHQEAKLDQDNGVKKFVLYLFFIYTL